MSRAQSESSGTPRGARPQACRVGNRADAWFAAAFALLVVLAAAPLRADQSLPRALEDVGIEEKLGAPVDLNLTFVAENGYPVRLGDYFSKGKPVVLTLVYYTCPMLCNLILNGTTQALRDVPWTPGNEYEVVTISIDPRDNFDVAKKKKASYLTSFERPAPGWHWLVDDHDNVKKLAGQVGFKYRWDEPTQQYAHAAAIFILTPDGRVSRYLYGIKFKPFDVRMALNEASDGKTGSTTDRFLMFCFHYDPKARGYVLFAQNVMRAGGALAVLILGAAILSLFRRERQLAKAHDENLLVTAR
jgi:protein SCO1